MAKVRVSRQQVTEENTIEWVVSEIDESELLEGEMPYVEPPTF
jgi:hypothetical protein